MPDRREELVRKMIAEGTSDDDIRATLKVFDAQQAPTPQAAAPDRAGYYRGIVNLLPSADTVANALPAIGGTIGAMIGGPAGAAAGSAAGVGARQIAQHGAEIPGAVADVARNWRQAPDMARAAVGGVESGAMDVGGNAAAAGGTAALPTVAGNMIPSAARAGQKFQSVMKVAKDVPVNLSEPGNVALRVADLAERGGGTNFGPAPVRQFIQWATNPKKEPMTYEVARDFASNISRLSVNDMQKMPPAIAYEVGNLRVALNKSIADAAGKAGMGKEYVEAMTEYAKAMRVREALRKAVPLAIGGGAMGAAAKYFMGDK